MSEMRYGTFNALEKLKKKLWAEYDHDRATVIVCVWDGPQAADAIAVFTALEETARRKEADVRIELKEIDGRDLEDQGPIVMLMPSYEIISHVVPADAPDLVDHVIQDYRVLGDFFRNDPENESRQLFAKPENQTARRSAKGFRLSKNMSGSEKTPTLGDTILGAYVLASKKTANLFGRKEGTKEKTKSSTRIALEQAFEKITAKYDSSKPNIIICAWEGKCASEAMDLYYAFRQAQDKLGSNARIHIKKIDAGGFKDQGPLVMTLPTRALYVKVRKYDAETIIRRTILRNEVLEGLLYREKVQEEPKTLTLTELAILAADNHSESDENLRNGIQSQLPAFLPVLEPRKLALIRSDALRMLGLNHLRGLDDGTESSLISASDFYYAEKTKAEASTKAIGISEAEEEPEEAEFLTVSQLMELAEHPDSQAKKSVKMPATGSRIDRFRYEHLSQLLHSAEIRFAPKLIVLNGNHAAPEEAEAFASALQDVIDEKGLKIKVKIAVATYYACPGVSLLLEPCGILYTDFTSADAERIIQKTLLEGRVLTDLLFSDPLTGNRMLLEDQIPFNRQQARILTEHFYDVAPDSLADYFSAGGYKALSKVLKSSENQSLNEIRESNLRSHYGLGTPLWQKMETCRQQSEDEKYVVAIGHCQPEDADVDGKLLAGSPHQVLEGLIIGAFLVGAEKGYIFIRSANEKAVSLTEQAIRDARIYGLLGKNILGTSFDFDVELIRSDEPAAGGEETAVLRFIEGRKAEPVNRPPEPEEKGLWNKPTLCDNVKTWAYFPAIFLRGGKTFSEIGSKSTGGSFLLALEGDSLDPCLVEVPAGMKIRNILSFFGNKNILKEVKAVQAGGITGQILPVDRLDYPFDFSLRTHANTRLGSMLKVYNSHHCVVRTAVNALKVSASEACGRCLTCRVGISRLIDLLEKITIGEGKGVDPELLKEVAAAVRDSSMCPLGAEAPIALLTSLKYFPEEYEAHLNGSCPAGRCPKLTDYLIREDQCTGCGDCQKVCPVHAIEGTEKNPRMIDPIQCIRCGRCPEVCPQGAIHYE